MACLHLNHIPWHTVTPCSETLPDIAVAFTTRFLCLQSLLKAISSTDFGFFPLSLKTFSCSQLLIRKVLFIHVFLYEGAEGAWTAHTILFSQASGLENMPGKNGMALPEHPNRATAHVKMEQRRRSFAFHQEEKGNWEMGQTKNRTKHNSQPPAPKPGN